MYAEIVLTKNTKALDQFFTYKIPEKLSINIGDKVIVPFGFGDSLSEGFVMNIVESTDYKRIKNILQKIDNVNLRQDDIDLIKWLKEKYLSTYSEGINAVVPAGTKLNKKTIYHYISDFDKLSKDERILLELIKSSKNITQKEIKKLNLYTKIKSLINKKCIEKEVLFIKDVDIIYKKIVNSLVTEDKLIYSLNKLSKNAIKQREVLKFIYEAKICDVALLNRELKCNKSVLDKLENLGMIEILEVERERKPKFDLDSKLDFSSLNIEQTAVYEEVEYTIEKNIFQTFLLHGVTGSGKTEIYINLAKKTLSKNKQAIILVPEISLTPQIVAKFLKRFGNQIAVIHSKLSPGERFDQYRSIKSGEISIIIGARSAIFSPVNNLGLIIIDEEHESTYKSETNPKYNTIEVAEYLGKKNNVPVLLASATPNINSYYKTEIGEYKLLEIKNRYSEHKLPKVSVVDMREELNSGNRSMFSTLLLEKMEETLKKKEQIILFYNRKGYSTFVSCRECGYALRCPNCDISLTYHHSTKKAKCSYCDHTVVVPSNCPECNSKYFKYFGTGTEKVEEMVAGAFPEAKIGRMDSETTSKKGSLENIIKSVENQEIDILIGTQMVTKGLDFENVTLVGALSADLSLNLPDYRAEEKTFQLLTQVAGRAGRGKKAGEVVIQSYEPENYAIINSITHDYNGFYKMEREIREIYEYPPFKEIVSILVVGLDEDKLIRSSNNLFKEIERFIYKKIDREDIKILGPNPAIFSKINKKYRWQIILKFDKMYLELIRNILKYICVKNKQKVVLEDVYISININPVSLL